MSTGTNGPSSKGDGGGAQREGQPLAGVNVVLGITGGIAAYKGAELCRLLVKAGAQVRVILTEAAGHFITPLTMQTLSGHPVARALFDLDEESQIGHIRLADDADLIIVAPATADAIARLAAGLANDLLAAVVLASRAPVLLAPAMNVNMWGNPITQANLGRLLGPAGGGRFATVGPDRGDLACGWVGEGRLIEPGEILAAAQTQVAGAAPRPARQKGRLPGASAIEGDLVGRRVVVTAGPTREPIDDVRFLGNRSSGKMGFAVAQAAAARGAAVTLITGPVALATPAGVAARVEIETAEDLRRALAVAAPLADVIVMAAAVADFRPATRVAGKLSRRGGDDAAGDGGGGVGSVGPAPVLALAANPDILAELGRQRKDAWPFLVGFAAEVGGGDALTARAREKLVEKRCDIIVANDVSAKGTGFDADDNQATLVFADGRAVALARAAKLAIADQIWDHVIDAIAGRARNPETSADTAAPLASTGSSPSPAASRRGS